MEAQPKWSFVETLLTRLALVALATLLAIGLWQAYGVWLFEEGPWHVA